MKAIYHGNSHQTSEELIRQLLHPPTKYIAVDVETVSLVDKSIIGIGIATTPNDSFYVPLYPETSEIFDRVYELVTRTDLTKIYHNGNFDIEGFRLLALDRKLPPPDVWNIADTNILANNSALPPDLHTLGIEQGVTEDLYLFTIPELLAEARQSIGKKTVTMIDVPLSKTALKCCNDVRTTFRLWVKLFGSMSDKVRDCYDVDIEATGWLKTIETRGLAINHEELNKRYSDLIVKAEIYEEWAEDLGFLISSNQQVGMYLANNRVVLPLTKGGHQLDTSEEVLSGVKHPAAKDILEYRRIRKILSTYIEPYLSSNRAFTHFRLDLSTGRLASFDNNLQNIPSDLRSIFMPDNNTFTWGDMSQAEMRTFAWFTQDPKMLEAYRNNVSIHEVTFKNIYPTLDYLNEKADPTSHWYTLAKSFNFAMIFDAEDMTLSKRFKIPYREAQQTKRDWLSLYSTAAKWMRDKANEDVTYVEDIYGRKMKLPDIFRGQKHINTCKINYTIQGSVASINKRAFIKIMRDGNPDLRLQVHDEFIIDGEYEFSKELDEIYPGLVIPFETNRGRVWS